MYRPCGIVSKPLGVLRRLVGSNHTLRSFAAKRLQRGAFPARLWP
jgi:hypothetical protein